MKKITQFLLKISCKLILAKYKPEIIGITGSVGKTSAKEAVFQVLSGHFSVRASSKNYNNEIGLPLTIIGVLAPKSRIGWFGVLARAWKIIFFKDKNYPNVLILEMGIDRPGDMDYLNTIVSPSMAILTMIGSSHLEFFHSRDNIAKEKKKIFNNLRQGGWAILNKDDDYTEEIIGQIKNKAVTFGFDQEADVCANNIICAFQDSKDLNSLAGINFKIKYQGAHIPVFLPGVISYTAIYAALVAVSVGFIYNLNGIEIADSLRKFKSPPGRMNLIEGVKDSMIIDDTYNSSPQSCLSALEITEQINSEIIKRKWLVLGDMLELGKASQESHAEIGKKCAEIKKGFLLLIGKETKHLAKSAIESGMSEEKIKSFESQEELAKYLREEIKAGDLILVKGSQGMRLEKIVKAVMAEPEKSKDLLVRQDDRWLRN